MLINSLLSFLANQNLDIRQRGKEPASRFIDQKVTPDVLSVIANSILSLNKETFTSRDIWDCSEFSSSVRIYFGKGDVNLQDFKNEYDKFIGQCINTLNFSGVISLIGKRSTSNLFKIVNKEILLFIASSDKNSYIFLLNFLKETLKQSGLWNAFENFFTSNLLTNTEYVILKDNFDKFMKNYSNIKTSNFYETKRIFPKVINPLAVDRQALGSRSGRLSKDIITYSELLYNRTNWRDINKPKGISRHQYRINNTEYERTRKYLIEKSKKSIKQYHTFKNPKNKLESEICDSYTTETCFHAHHIFPECDYEEISDALENIIILTAGQHYSFAHPNGNTNIVSKEYQKKCLLAKLNTILFSQYSEIYDINRFIEVLEIGLNITISDDISLLSSNNDIYKCLSKVIINYYDSYANDINFKPILSNNVQAY